MPENELVIGHLNIRSLIPTFNYFKNYTLSNGLIRINWLNLDSIAIPGYNVLRPERNGKITQLWIRQQQIVLLIALE